MVQKEYGIDQNFACVLNKHIPSRAGLAGGSADAAAAIRMMNRMLNLHMNTQELIRIGNMVGSDVPFCIFNKPSYVEGTGDILMPFDCRMDCEILLVKPRKGVSTREAFAYIDEIDAEHPDCMKMKTALISDDYWGMIDSLGNSLEAASLDMVKDIRTIKESLLEFGFDGALMSGSGSTVFGITRNRALVEEAMTYYRNKKYFVRHTRMLNGRI